MMEGKKSSNADICLICYPYYPSNDTGRGQDRIFYELAQNLTKFIPEDKIEVLHQGFSRGVLVAAAKLFRLLFDLFRARHRLFHAISPIGGLVALLMRKRPLVVTIHDLLPYNLSASYDSIWKFAFLRFCIKTCVRKSDLVMVPYSVTKDEMISRFNVPSDRIRVIHYGVDHSSYYPRPETGRLANRVLYIGEVSRAKGTDIVVRAFSIVKKAFPGAELLIGGRRSKDQPLLEALSSELGLRDVTFLGYIPENELASHYAAATVMIFPSRCGFGLSTLEAMACGTPVIVGAVFDAPEFIGDAGMLVDPDDIDGMADSVIRILTDSRMREQLSAKGIAKAGEFSWGTMARKTAEAYQEILLTPKPAN